MALASHQLTRELHEKGKGSLARMHLMIFPKIKQDKTLGQLIDAFAVDTKEVIEVFKRTSRTYGALLAFQLMMGYVFKGDIVTTVKEPVSESTGWGQTMPFLTKLVQGAGEHKYGQTL